MIKKTRSLKYRLYIEGVQIPVQSLQFNNISGQGCTLTASIPPHPTCYVLRRGMAVQLFKSVNDGVGVLRFSGILVNKVYGKSGEGRDLRIECASPEVRLTTMKVAEIDSANLSMLNIVDLKSIQKMFDGLTGLKCNSTFELLSAYADGQVDETLPFHINSDSSKGFENLVKDIKDGTKTKKKVEDDLKAIHSVEEKFNAYASRQATEEDIKNKSWKYKEAYSRMNEAANDYRKSMGEKKAADDAVSSLNKQKSDIEKKMKEVNGDNKQAGLASEKQRLEKELVSAKKEAAIKDTALTGLSATFKESAQYLDKNGLGNMDISDYVNYMESDRFFKHVDLATKDYKKNGVSNNVQTALNVGMAEINQTSSTYASTLLTEKQQEITMFQVPANNGEIGDKDGDKSWQQITKPTYARQFTMFAKEENIKNDYFKAFVKLLGYFYSLSNDERIKDEADLFHIYYRTGDYGDCFYSLGVVNGSSFSQAETGFETQVNTSNHYTPIAKHLGDVINQTIHASEGGVPIISIVQQVLGVMMAKYSVVHTQFHRSIVIHPIMCNYFPPCRNVVFPNMISSIQYNANDWANPTRTYMIYQSYLRPYTYQNAYAPSKNLPATIAVAPKEARQLKCINYRLLKDTIKQNEMPEEKDEKDKTQEDIEKENTRNQDNLRSKVESYNAVNAYTTEEEEDIGRSTNIVNFGLGNLIKSTSYSQIQMADMYHGLAKYSCRTCLINGGDELDDVVVGMPILVLDHVYSIYGIVESLSFSATGDGNVQATINISMPRMPLHNDYDVLTHAGLWFNTPMAAPDNISKSYTELFYNTPLDTDQSLLRKCKAFADPDNLVDVNVMEDDVENMDDDTTLLRMCIARLNNAYISSSNKEAFVRSFRDVAEEREDGEDWQTLKSLCKRANKVKEYKASLELNKDGLTNKYARVTPDSLSYDTMGYIAINVKAPKKTAEEEEFGNIESDMKTLLTKEGDEASAAYERIFSSSNVNVNNYSKEEIEAIRANMNGLELNSLNSPVKNAVNTSAFGYRIHPTKKIRKFHSGIDIAVNGNTPGTRISSVADGVVTKAEYMGGYGNTVVVDHGNGYTTWYAHCREMVVKPGQYVKAGDKIAGMGRTGTTNAKDNKPTSGVHCHFEVRKNNNFENPENYLKSGALGK